MVYEMDRPNDEVEFPGMNVGYVRVSAVGVDVTADVAAQKMGIQRFVEDRGGVESIGTSTRTLPGRVWTGLPCSEC